MKAIILAGGKGERLKSVTRSLPKPMIRVCGKPVLEHIIKLFKKNGLTDLIVSLYYLPEKITSYFESGRKFGVNIRYIYEDKNKPLGTAGAIIKAKKFIDNTFIVAYGDILRELDIKKMINYHRKNKVLATIAVYRNSNPNPKSEVRFDKDGLITVFQERPNAEKIKGKVIWSNASFYVFEPGIFDFLPENRASDFGKDIFPKVIASGGKVIAYRQKGYLFDIGDLKKLKKAKNYFSQRTGELTIA